MYRPSNTHLHRTFLSHVLWKHESPCITNPLLTFAANHLLNYLLIGYTYHPLLQGRLGHLRRLVGIIGKTPSPGFVVWSSVPWSPFGEHGQHNARFQVRACTFCSVDGARKQHRKLASECFAFGGPNGRPGFWPASVARGCTRRPGETNNRTWSQGVVRLLASLGHQGIYGATGRHDV